MIPNASKHSCCIQKYCPLQVCFQTTFPDPTEFNFNKLLSKPHPIPLKKCFTIQQPTLQEGSNPNRSDLPQYVVTNFFSYQTPQLGKDNPSHSHDFQGFKSQLLHTKLLSSASLLSNRIFQIQHNSTSINYYRSPVPLHTPLKNASRFNNVPYKIWYI